MPVTYLIAGVFRASGLTFDEQSIKQMAPGSSISFQLDSLKSRLTVIDSDSFTVNACIAGEIKPMEHGERILDILGKAMPFYNEYEINVCLLPHVADSGAKDASGVLRTDSLSSLSFPAGNILSDSSFCDLCLEILIRNKGEHLSDSLQELESFYQLADWLRTQWFSQ